MERLPVELIYKVQLYALSERFPIVSQYFKDLFTSASPFFRAQYIVERVLSTGASFTSVIYTEALQYPICNQLVLDAMHDLIRDFPSNNARVRLPRRLFRSLCQPSSGWTTQDHPVPFLRYLYDNSNIPEIYTNTYDGYPLTRAVHAKFRPLVQLLLEKNASPSCHHGLAVKVAIRQKDLPMLKILVERQDSKHNVKRRKYEDRLTLDSSFLKVAVMSNAKDIVEYLFREKNVLPDVETLKKMIF